MADARCMVFLAGEAGGNKSSPTGVQIQCADLPGAVERSRAYGPSSGKTIILGDGRHDLDCPLCLDVRDCGLTIASAPGAEPVLIGGRRLSGWRPDGDGLWAADIPAAREGMYEMRLLVVNGRMRPRARLPREGFFEHRSGWAIPWMSTTGGGWQRKPTSAELTAMYAQPGDPVFVVDPRNAEITIYHQWDESTVGIAETDESSGVVKFSTPAAHPPGAFGVYRYVIWNVREGIGEPGRWYCDRTRGKVVYHPLPGEDLSGIDVLAPTMESVICIEGTERAPVRGLTIRGVTLMVTTVPLKAGGFGSGEFNGALSVSHAHDVLLSGLKICNVAGQGIRARACDNLTIERCLIHDTGACGILTGSGRTVIRDNTLHHVGMISPAAIGIFCQGDHGGQGSDIVHNTVEDTPYSAIVCSGDHHLIKSNLIRRAMTEMRDGAGIYITFCRQVTVQGNVVQDIGGGDTSAYYLDEQAVECMVEENVSLQVERPSHNHMARNNRIVGNTFVNRGLLRLTFPRSMGYVLERNTLVAGGPIRFVCPESITVMENNRIFSAERKVEGVSGNNSYEYPGIAPDGSGLQLPCAGARLD